MTKASPWLSGAVWASVAAELRGHLETGLRRVLTEDVVRFATAKALVAAGVDAAEARFEAPHPALKGARVDLAVGWPEPAALIELKFPREPHATNAPRTMVLGNLLKDFYRLAACSGEVDRIFVYVENDVLRRYAAGTARRHGLRLDTDTVTLAPAAIAGLPATALQSIGTDLARHHVTASRLAVIPIDDELRLDVYLVDPLTHTPEPVRTPSPRTPSPRTPSPRMPRNGARQEILDAARAVLTRSGATTFTLAEVLTEMARRDTRYKEQTIRTMVTSHLCRNAPDHAATTYDDFERVGRGVYRFVTG
ncbi:DUF7669 domain-containing protein [Lentzea sp.]|uniref:DUF7669 domain-containing protein n=1 Tax=Lentzea sp. TaxID=56099 RepID=UPI002ED57968